MFKKIIMLIILSLFLVWSVNATTINLLDSGVDKLMVGVTVDNDYYVVTTDNGKLQKIELNGKERVNYEVTTTKVKLVNLAQKYFTMNRIEKIKYIYHNFDIPIGLMMRLIGEEVKI